MSLKLVEVERLGDGDFRGCLIDKEGAAAAGRQLGWRELGPADGRPLLYFHGFPASRLEAMFASSAAHLFGLRIIAVDRPGFGHSEFQPGRQRSDWPADITALLDQLGLDQVDLLAISGGAPYALVTSWALRARIRRCALVCGLGPLDHGGAVRGMGRAATASLLLARHAPIPIRLFYQHLAAPVFRRRPDIPLAWLLANAHPVDREVLRIEKNRQLFQASVADAFRAGGRGPAWELTLLPRPWEFPLEEIEVPVQLWHGELDGTVPVTLGRHIAARLPHCIPRFLPSEGHFSLPIRHIGRILSTLVESAQ